jgi:N-acetyl-anhydromuramyl-L-alanine amidase AmpD
MALPEYPIARVFASGNYNSRPDDSFPHAIVMHATVGEAIPSLNWLSNPASQASVHYLVDRDGTVYQMVSEELRAWHAGPSYYNGMNDWNSFSIGIEMVNRNDGIDPYSPALMAAVKKLAIYLVGKYGVEPEMIVSHKQISGALTGKSDPRGFPLEAFIMSVAQDLPNELRTAAWMALGISYNPNAALQEKAKELDLGHPVTNELRTVINGVRWTFQGFDRGIVATEEGNWGNVRRLDWL